MLLSGVRSSWLTVAKKSLLSRFISYSRMLAWASSSSRSSSSPLLCRRSLCWLEKLPQHAVERGAELFELVARANDGPLLDVALADRVGHVAQMGHRLDDHIPHDGPQRKHRNKPDDNRRRPQTAPDSWPPRLPSVRSRS